jgi:hypothetical protein
VATYKIYLFTRGADKSKRKKAIKRNCCYCPPLLVGSIALDSFIDLIRKLGACLFYDSLWLSLF